MMMDKRVLGIVLVVEAAFILSVCLPLTQRRAFGDDAASSEPFKAEAASAPTAEDPPTALPMDESAEKAETKETIREKEGEEKSERSSSVNMQIGQFGSLNILMSNLPGVESTGYLVAEERGFYTREGISQVNLLNYENIQPFTDQLKNGNCQFADFWLTEGYKARLDGADVVAIACLVPESTAGFAISKLAFPYFSQINQLAGLRFAIWQNKTITPTLFLKREQIDGPKTIQKDSSGFLFKKGSVGVLFYTSYNTEVLLRYSPIRDNLVFFPFAKAGFDLPENAIFCSGALLREKPELCRAFVLGTFRGWSYAKENPDEAARILRRYCQQYGTLSDEFLLKKQLLLLLDHLHLSPDLKQNGGLTEKKFQEMSEAFDKAQIGGGRPTYEEFFCPILSQP